MPKYTKDIATLLASKAFCRFANADTMKLAEVNAAITLLIKANIDFDLQFISGTRRHAPKITLIINITPSSTITFTINLEPSGNLNMQF
ncbi:hypothetical protein [Crassaminicella indica]|uniref:Uncharacterized protein n=1 Tax=Crassaminicella indica TaxID=2855394 RepID=A0ABX8RF81_9CLOT|nr:hypothetical protein [Crassaminicella indica]QXM05601.1 hypothetical protein KVH43_09480 [Crassaminicella indica]